MTYDIVFDLDETLLGYVTDGTFIKGDPRYIEFVIDGPIYYANKEFTNLHIQHFVMPGAIEILSVLNQIPEVRISFCSSGHRERNIRVLEKIKVLDKINKNKKLVSLSDIAYKILSNQDLLDVTRTLGSDQEANKFGPNANYVLLKKNLLLIDSSDIKNCILVDDNPSYILQGQEENFFKTQGIDNVYYPEIIAAVPLYIAKDILRTKNNLIIVLGMIIEGIRLTKINPTLSLSKFIYEIQQNNLYADYDHPCKYHSHFYTVGLSKINLLFPAFNAYYYLSDSEEIRPLPSNSPLKKQSYWDLLSTEEKKAANQRWAQINRQFAIVEKEK
ncbi:MAG: hypothetical protein HQK53_00650 [Oligoflexia bacterium]|nr:hypothetical protein [Oligoflexia bacterium]